MARVRVRVRGVAADRAARHADAATAKPDRERSLVIRRRWVALLLTILGAVGWYVHASTHTVLLHRPLRDAEHYEGQAGAAELDAGRSAPKSHGSIYRRSARQWQSRWSSTVRRRDVCRCAELRAPGPAARTPNRARADRRESIGAVRIHAHLVAAGASGIFIHGTHDVPTDGRTVI